VTRAQEYVTKYFSPETVCEAYLAAYDRVREERYKKSR